ncbi:MAG: hypothetical protein F4239_05740 [Gammaproteobacteria bacterium]|nr:hypothetical protein [Gammaproteobacteria bacterium]
MGYSVEITPMDQETMFDVRCITPILDDFVARFKMEESPDTDEFFSSVEFNILKLGPRRLLIQSSLNQEYQIEQRAAACNSDPQNLSVVNVSDLYLGIQLVGTDALEVLAHAVPLNLHEFAIGEATSTAVFSIAGIVTRTAGDSFSLYIDRSYFDYVWYRLHVCGLKNASGLG